MRVTILCTDPGHPVYPHLKEWVKSRAKEGHHVALIQDRAQALGGDFLFLVSCSQIVGKETRSRYRATLVLHASDLPRGRGWSPHVWAIVRGASEITVCLLEADDPVDSGAVWLRRRLTLEGHELLAEINSKLFEAELGLMTEAVQRSAAILPEKQAGDAGEYLVKRTPEHSRLDAEKTLAEQFDLLRVVDSDRYPAFFDFRGHRYLVKIEKSDA